MSSLTDSEDEADQRPVLGQMVNPLLATGAPATLLQPTYSKKHGCQRVIESGDTGKNGTKTDDTHNPDNYVKKRKTENLEVSEAARKMMAKMGHKEGKGLGKHNQGRTEIVEESTQRGRRGLGMTISGLEPSNIEWDFIKEEIIIEEVVSWLPQYTGEMPSFEEMKTWKVVGQQKRFIDDETNFCPEETLKLVVNGKNIFDQLEPEEMRRARTRSNPYETIRGAFFLNRAAMKMANMDAVLNFMFTNPKKPNGESLVEPNELLYFSDICAGPGGFSEYILWRRKGESKGFGMTLKGSNDFKLADFFAGPPEMFEPHYGVGGLQGDGDIFQPDNQAAFIKFVHSSTDGKGVHIVMADGGFSVEGQENIQEILSKQLYLCQFLVAISVLRTGGHFVCKLFDVFTPFSVGLIYLMNMIFERVAIFKPVTSRPANSERYLVCKSLKADKEAVQQYFHSVNLDLKRYLTVTSTEDLIHIVPLTTLRNDEPFFIYMVNSNENLAKNQAIHLKKIEVFTRNSDLHETRQSETRANCLKLWQIPDAVRAAPGRPDPNAIFKALTEDIPADMFDVQGSVLTQEKLHTIKCLSSYSCLVKGDGPSFFILGCGRSSVYKWDGREQGKWLKLDDSFRVELPNKTLLEVQAVTELRGEGKGQRKQTCIHILDAFFLCGEDVRQMSYEKRQEKLAKFVKALRKPTRSDLTQLYKPEVFPLEEVDKAVQKLSMRMKKGSAKISQLCFSADSGNFYPPSGLNIIQTVKEPWIRSRSNSTGRQYWYNIITRQSVYECPAESVATVKDCKQGLLFWPWTGILEPGPPADNPDLVPKDLVIEHINKLKQC